PRTKLRRSNLCVSALAVTAWFMTALAHAPDAQEPDPVQRGDQPRDDREKRDREYELRPDDPQVNVARRAARQHGAEQEKDREYRGCGKPVVKKIRPWETYLYQFDRQQGESEEQYTETQGLAGK